MNNLNPMPERAHPKAVEYVAVAAVLTVVTVIEVWVYYVHALRGVLVPILLALSAAKFSLVVLFYMHLKYDSRLFAAIFVGGMTLAGSILLALLVLFKII